MLDCIDNIDTKVDLLSECTRRGLRVLASAGAGAKADPTRLAVADISQTAIDPLARSVRYRLKKDHGVVGGVPVLLSTERPCAALVDHTPEGSDAKDFQTVPGFRIRTIPVLGPLPALFGQAMAAIVLGHLSQKIDVRPAQCFRLESEQYRVLFWALVDRERSRLDDYEVELDVDIDEVRRFLFFTTFIAARWRFGTSTPQSSRSLTAVLRPSLSAPRARVLRWRGSRATCGAGSALGIGGGTRTRARRVCCVKQSISRSHAGGPSAPPCRTTW